MKIRKTLENQGKAIIFGIAVLSVLSIAFGSAVGTVSAANREVTVGVQAFNIYGLQIANIWSTQNWNYDGVHVTWYSQNNPSYWAQWPLEPYESGSSIAVSKNDGNGDTEIHWFAHSKYGASAPFIGHIYSGALSLHLYGKGSGDYSYSSSQNY